MIRVDLSTLAAAREPVPANLHGLDADTLRNLQSILDPVPADLAGLEWWPEVDETPAFDPLTHKPGAETLTPDMEAKVIRVVREIVPLTEEELEALKPPVPATVSSAQLRIQLHRLGLLSDVETVVQAAGANDPEVLIRWNAPTMERHNPMLIALAAQVGLDDADCDDIFRQAALI